MKQGTTDLRGDAAWRAQLVEIGKRNEAARAAAARRRQAQAAFAAEGAAAWARREALYRPSQPGR